MGRENVWRLGSGMSMSVTSLCPSCPVGPLIGKYCGTKTPSELRSATGILSLTFHTDMAVAKDGFSARYYLVHQEPLESELAGWEALTCPPMGPVRVISAKEGGGSWTSREGIYSLLLGRDE